MKKKLSVEIVCTSQSALNANTELSCKNESSDRRSFVTRFPNPSVRKREGEEILDYSRHTPRITYINVTDCDCYIHM